MAPQSSTLAWKIPWMEEPGGLQSMGSLRVGHDWATSLSLFTFMHWRRNWQPTPVFLPGESQGRGSLVYGVTWSWTRLKRHSSSRGLFDLAAVKVKGHMILSLLHYLALLSGKLIYQDFNYYLWTRDSDLLFPTSNLSISKYLKTYPFGCPSINSEFEFMSSLTILKLLLRFLIF